jgi:hypothetical protein
VVAGQPRNGNEISVHQLVEDGWDGPMVLSGNGSAPGAPVVPFDHTRAFGRRGRALAETTVFEHPELLAQVNLGSVKDNDNDEYAGALLLGALNSGLCPPREGAPGGPRAEAARQVRARAAFAQSAPKIAHVAPRTTAEVLDRLLSSGDPERADYAEVVIPALARSHPDRAQQPILTAISEGRYSGALAALPDMAAHSPEIAHEVLASQLAEPESPSSTGRLGNNRATAISHTTHLATSDPDHFADLLPSVYGQLDQITPGPDHDQVVADMHTALRTELSRPLPDSPEAQRVRATTVSLAVRAAGEQPGTFTPMPWPPWTRWRVSARPPRWRQPPRPCPH